MELTRNRGDGDRITRVLLAAGLAVFALRALRRGKRLLAVLAGLGAVAVGYGVRTGFGDASGRTAAPDTEPEIEEVRLRCAICDEPIVAGQSRTPNENDETVHEACLEAPA